jgi:hypothetical protein
MASMAAVMAPLPGGGEVIRVSPFFSSYFQGEECGSVQESKNKCSVGKDNKAYWWGALVSSSGSQINASSKEGWRRVDVWWKTEKNQV